MFDLDDDPTRNNVAWFLIGDFLRFSLWNGGLGQQAQVVVLMDKPLGGPRATPLGKFFWPVW